MEKSVATRQTTPVERLKMVIAAPSVQEQFQNAMKENASLFVASLIDLYAGDTYLQQCDPKLVIMEALKAATLKLPINKSLGFAYVVPYKGKPQFQIGYRGLIQLAIRSGIYRVINADVVLEGELVKTDKLTGGVDLSGFAQSELVIGYFAHIETTNGFCKTIYWSREKMEEHAKRYSKAYQKESSPWSTDFDKMAIKTALRELLGKYGLLSVEMVSALEADNDTIDFTTGEIIENGTINDKIKEAKQKGVGDHHQNAPEDRQEEDDRPEITVKIQKEIDEINNKSSVDALDVWSSKHIDRLEKQHGKKWTEYLMGIVHQRRMFLRGESPEGGKPIVSGNENPAPVMITCPMDGYSVNIEDCKGQECNTDCGVFAGISDQQAGGGNKLTIDV